jgi:hypothetical protein
MRNLWAHDEGPSELSTCIVPIQGLFRIEASLDRSPPEYNPTRIEANQDRRLSG